MKHVKQSRNPILREIYVDTPSSNPSPIKQTKPSSQKQKFSKENDPPFEISVVPDSSPSPSFTGKSSPAAGKLKSSPLPPRPPPSKLLSGSLVMISPSKLSSLTLRRRRRRRMSRCVAVAKT
ncbi:hypothetical protein L1987_46300 [Smallanthus sonchifolius]|uniref:Uncharacterized protein n=1 Tax=Smallanthus sonchifolius TaxID=185202 RepID=A0ACB9G0C7_9ASTR|nr:hypothetical protein L1987_46300 [Smallanthus sonchifolius]